MQAKFGRHCTEDLPPRPQAWKRTSTTEQMILFILALVIQSLCEETCSLEQVLIKESSSGLTAKSADFGMSLSDGSHPYGTPEYMPAECWHEKYGTPDQASDVFSFGILLWEMFARRRVYTGLIPDDCPQVADGSGNFDVGLVATWMTVSRRRPEFPASCPPAWRLLCEACWVLPPPPAPCSTTEQESADDLIARHKQAMGARPPSPRSAKCSDVRTR